MPSDARPWRLSSSVRSRRETEHAGRAAEGHGRAAGDRGRQGRTERHRAGARQDGRSDDLHRPAAQGQGPEGAESRQRELEPDAEEEEGDADVGERPDFRLARDHVEGVRPEEDPGQDVADDGALSEPLEEGTQAEPPGKQDDDVGKQGPGAHGVSLHGDPPARRKWALDPTSGFPEAREGVPLARPQDVGPVARSPDRPIVRPGAARENAQFCYWT
jgi:hypothetical protein